MAFEGKFLFVVRMDVSPEKEGVFNEVYNTEHVEDILKVPGVLSAARYRTEEFEVMLGGEKKRISPAGEPSYLTVYELESADVLTGEGWAEAVEGGRWPSEVRPHTYNRRHRLYRRLQS